MPILTGINTWALTARGIVAILFAIMAVVFPGLTLSVLVILFGAYALVDGIFAIVLAIRAAHGHRRWGAFLVEGATGVIIGLITLFVPVITLAFLIYLIAAWAVVTGVLEIAAAFRLRKHISGEWLLVLSGILSILFGVFVFWTPIVGAIVIAWWLGAYAFVWGILMLTLAFRLHRIHKTVVPVQA